MKVIGYLLVGLGILDVILYWFHPYGSPIDEIVGSEIGEYSPWVLMTIGYFFISKNSDGEDQENTLLDIDSSSEDQENTLLDIDSSSEDQENTLIDIDSPPGEDWVCEKCNEQIAGNFDTCWNCSTNEK